MALSQHDLLRLLESPRSADGLELVRGAAERMPQELIEAEATARIGAERNEHTDTRTGFRTARPGRQVQTPARRAPPLIDVCLPEIRLALDSWSTSRVQVRSVRFPASLPIKEEHLMSDATVSVEAVEEVRPAVLRTHPADDRTIGPPADRTCAGGLRLTGCSGMLRRLTGRMPEAASRRRDHRPPRMRETRLGRSRQQGLPHQTPVHVPRAEAERTEAWGPEDQGAFGQQIVERGRRRSAVVDRTAFSLSARCLARGSRPVGPAGDHGERVWSHHRDQPRGLTRTCTVRLIQASFRYEAGQDRSRTSHASSRPVPRRTWGRLRTAPSAVGSRPTAFDPSHPDEPTTVTGPLGAGGEGSLVVVSPGAKSVVGAVPEAAGAVASGDEDGIRA